MARRCGIRVEVFSIGFGPEIYGWTDKRGTRWKFAIIPLGGFVKMFGDADPASRPDRGLQAMTPEEKEVSFHFKRVSQRMGVVFGGPAANFIFAIVLLTGLFTFVGQPSTPPDIGSVQEGSAAEAAGLKPGDVVVSIDGSAVSRFEDIQRVVRDQPGVPLKIIIRRDGTEQILTVAPRATEVTDRFGQTHQIGLLGIGRAGMTFVRHDPLTATWNAVKDTYFLSWSTLKAVGQIVAGTRTAGELGGPLRIAQMSGNMAEQGTVSLIWFIAVLSINLGLINLFPVPMLDGGHLLFYSIEAARGRPLGQRAQEYGFRIGLALVFGLMLFVTWNDLVQLKVVAFFEELLT
jgi:regulator of sigma E protease